MFCKNCGTQLADDARFCENCGTATDNAPVAAAPSAAAAPNPMFENFMASSQSFVQNPITAIGKAAKSNTLEWVLFAVLAVFMYAIGNAVVGLETMSKALGDASRYVKLLEIYPFFKVFGIGLLVGTAAFALTAAGIWVLMTSVFRKQVEFTNVLNMVAIASVPFTAIYVLNMIIGLIYVPLTGMLVSAAFVMVILLLYSGMQKLAELEQSPFYGFSAVMACVIIIVRLLEMLY